MVQGYEMKDDLKPVLVKESRTPPVLINPSDLGGAYTTGKVFTFGVRTKSAEVSAILGSQKKYKIMAD